jgi:hypothetical protein
MAKLLNHLAHDDEILWTGAIVGGDEECIGLVQDGWQVPVTSGEGVVAQYRRWRWRSDAVLAEVDLEGGPAGGPRRGSLPSPPFVDARAYVFRVLEETATHAGHLDIVRKGIDGRQHLVVGERGPGVTGSRRARIRSASGGHNGQ